MKDLLLVVSGEWVGKASVNEPGHQPPGLTARYPPLTTPNNPLFPLLHQPPLTASFHSYTLIPLPGYHMLVPQVKEVLVVSECSERAVRTERTCGSEHV